MPCQYFFRISSAEMNVFIIEIPLTNGVRGPYCKFVTEIYGPSAKRVGFKDMGKNEDS